MSEERTNETSQELKEVVKEEVEKNLMRGCDLWKGIVGRSVWGHVEQYKDTNKFKIQMPDTVIKEKIRKFQIIWIEAMEKLLEKVRKNTGGKFTIEEIRNEIIEKIREAMKEGEGPCGDATFETVQFLDYLQGLPTPKGCIPIREEDVKQWLE